MQQVLGGDGVLLLLRLRGAKVQTSLCLMFAVCCHGDFSVGKLQVVETRGWLRRLGAFRWRDTVDTVATLGVRIDMAVTSDWTIFLLKS